MGFTVQYPNGAERTFWAESTAASEVDNHEGAIILSSGDDVDEINVDDTTKEALYEQAQELDIAGRSDMDKAELADAVTKAKRDADEEAAIEDAARVKAEDDEAAANAAAEEKANDEARAAAAEGESDPITGLPITT